MDFDILFALVWHDVVSAKALRIHVKWKGLVMTPFGLEQPWVASR